MRIVVELIEETIGKIVLRDVMKLQEDIVKEKDDEEETTGRILLRDVKDALGCRADKNKEQEDILVEADDKDDDKAVQMDSYDRMSFNWVEVQPLFRG